MFIWRPNEETPFKRDLEWGGCGFLEGLVEDQEPIQGHLFAGFSCVARDFQDVGGSCRQRHRADHQPGVVVGQLVDGFCQEDGAVRR